MSFLDVRGLAKAYPFRFGGAAGRLAARALDSVSFSMEAGEFVAVMGPSGAGKTTLLNLIALIDTPDSGDILFDGESAVGLPNSRRIDFRRRHIGFVFQDSSLIDTMTLAENIALPLALDRRPAAEIDERVGSLAAALGIGGLADKYPAEVSGGERQRTACARAMALKPSLLLADEPTGALDSKAGRTLMECFRSLNGENRTAILMVTHDPFAASWAGRGIFLRDGRVFTELRRSGDRHDFFERIMDVQRAMEGGQA